MTDQFHNRHHGSGAIRAVDKTLLAHPFVFGMSRQDIGLLADCATMVHFSNGAVIFHEGENADRVFLIEKGAVILESIVGSESVVTETIRGGELLGLSWLFPPHKWKVTARACEPTSAIGINGRLLRKYSERDDSLSLHLHRYFTEVLARRFQAMRKRFLDSVSHDGASPRCE